MQVTNMNSVSKVSKERNKLKYFGMEAQTMFLQPRLLIPCTGLCTVNPCLLMYLSAYKTLCLRNLDE